MLLNKIHKYMYTYFKKFKKDKKKLKRTFAKRKPVQLKTNYSLDQKDFAPIV